MTKMCLTLLLLGTSLWTTKVLAHGAKITYQATQALVLQASYDDGKPMIDAQVVVYAPSEPSKPWLKGKTDAQGKFVFTPDSSLVGNWEVKVRRAGHGDIITIPVGQTLALGQISSAADYTPLQKMLMSLSTVWGFVGTALFFAQKKGNS